MPSLRHVAIVVAALLATTVVSCRVTRHIPQDASVVSRVHFEEDGQRTSDDRLRMAVVQKPYHRTFGFLPVSTWIWHNDTTSRWHRWRNRVGTAPAIYNETASRRSENAMERVLSAEGFLNASVSHTTSTHRRKTTVTYSVTRGQAHRIWLLNYEVEDDSLRQHVMESLSPKATLLHVGDALNRNILEQERTRLTLAMRNKGYWDFNKEDISYTADTLSGETDVELTMTIGGKHRVRHFGRVRFVTDFDLMASRQDSGRTAPTTLRPMQTDGFEIQYEGEKCYLRDKTLLENCFIHPGAQYTETALTETYTALCRLHLLRYVNLRVEPDADSTDVLNCNIYLSPRNPHTIQFEADGTNTSGDLGFALALTYQHRNLFRGSETYTASVKSSYESLSGNLSGLVNDNYTEYAFDNQLDFPKFLTPFLSEEVRRRSRATTGVQASYSYQKRPEYTRIITQGAFSYKWLADDARRRHQWDVFNLSYVYLPKKSDAFVAIVRNLGPISYSSYQSHMILSMGYSLTAGNTASARMQRTTSTQDIWALRINPEIAGNVLEGVSHMAGIRKEDGRHVIFDQPFEQYAKFDMDWTYSKFLTDRSRLAFHLAGGVAVPYGNSEVMPFEKRYYAGGANSVRGWSVRQLGPGRYHNENSAQLDYFNQCGDVRLDLSVELRSRLFWNFEFAAFIDGGNIWTLRHYDSQPNGAFDSDFYREIAAAWGVGLRLVTDFVILRLDLGLKAYDPTAEDSEAWRLKHPLESSNRTLHFAVGYPF